MKIKWQFTHFFQAAIYNFLYRTLRFLCRRIMLITASVSTWTWIVFDQSGRCKAVHFLKVGGLEIKKTGKISFKMNVHVVTLAIRREKMWKIVSKNIKFPIEKRRAWNINRQVVHIRSKIHWEIKTSFQVTFELICYMCDPGITAFKWKQLALQCGQGVI